MPPSDEITDQVFQRLEQQKELYVRALRNTSQELEGKIRELSVLGQLGQLFRSSTRLEDVAGQALRMFLQSSDAENASIMLYSPTTEELTILAALGRGEGRIAYYGPGGYPRASFVRGDGLAGSCLAEGAPIAAEDATADPRFLPGVGTVAVGSIACLPLAVSEQPLGVVNLSSPGRGQLDPRHLPVWSILASYLSIAISHALLFRELREANQKLEERIRQRTRRLEAANRELRTAQTEIAHNNEILQQRVAERTSELETALEELRTQHASLEEANRIKDEFLNNINHELKTPLNAIIGYAGLLLRETEGVLPAEQRADLELVEANGKHLQHILENILALKEAERGVVDLDRKRGDLNELVQSAVASVRPRAREKGLELVFEPLDVPPVQMDPTLILRAVFNLLDNAIKFTSRGKISVRTHLAQGDPANPQTAQPSAGPEGRVFAVVEVEDQGPGVRPEDVERIFQKFQQAEPPTTKHKGGSGVGLTIAKNLVELHGGRIWLLSRPGVGSTFSFSLPIE